MPEIDPVILRYIVDTGKGVADIKATGVAVQRSFDQQSKSVLALERQMEASGQRIGSSIRGAIGGALAALSAATLFQLAKGALEYASSLGEVSQQLGVTSRDLQVFQYAGSQVGLTNDEVRDGLSKLTRTLGEAATGVPKSQKVLQLLGFSLEEVKSGALTAGAAIPRIADALSKIPSPTQRAAIEVELFGRAGQRLDTLLSGGSGAIDELARAAEHLGIILSDDQIQRADETADKLSEVKQVLAANIAGVVADNARSIVGLASALGSLTGEIVKFLNSNPQLALTIAGGLAGLSVGGPVGGVVGGAAGYAAGQSVAQKQADQNNDLKFRRQAYAEALHQAARRGNPAKYASGTYRQDKATLAANLPEALAEVARQRNLLNLASKGGGAAKTGPTDPKLQAQLNALNAPATPKGPKGKSASQLTAEAARKAEQAAREQARYENELTRSHTELLDAQADLTGGIEARYKAEVGRIEDDRAEYANSVSLLKGLTQAQREELIAAHDAVLSKRAAIAEQDRSFRLAQDSYDLARADNQAQQEALSIQSQLVDSMTARRDLEVQLLQKRKEAERLYLQSIIDTTKTSDPANANAVTSLGTLDARYAAQAAVLSRQNQTPGQAFVTNVNRSAAGLNEDYQRVAVDGLQSLNDQLADAIANSRSLGDVFKNVADQIVAGLLRIAIQQAVIKPLANAFFGGGEGSGGGLGGLLGSVASLFGGGGNNAGLAASIGASSRSALDFLKPNGFGIPGGTPGYIPGFASGGSMKLGGRGGVDQNLLSLNGRPLARVSAGEVMSINTNAQAVSPAGGGDRHFHISVDARNSVTPAGFADAISRSVLAQAAQMDAVSVKGAQRGLPAAQARYGKLGTTG